MESEALNPALRPGAESSEFEAFKTVAEAGKAAGALGATLTGVGPALLATPLAPAAPWVAAVGVLLYGFSRLVPVVSQLIYTSSRTKVKLQTSKAIGAKEIEDLRISVQAIAKETRTVSQELSTALERAQRGVGAKV